MPAPGRIRFAFRYPDAVKRKLDVAAAMAWEALVQAHTRHALEFISLLDGHAPFDESAVRYIREMDIPPHMAAAVQTRVLAALEQRGVDDWPGEPGPRPDPHDAGASGGWRRLRPRDLLRGVRHRQRRHEEVDRIAELALARAEEGVIRVHVEHAARFAELLEPHFPLRRGIDEYIDALGLAGGRAQSVFQRAMARIADRRLPLAGLDVAPPGPVPRRRRGPS